MKNGWDAMAGRYALDPQICLMGVYIAGKLHITVTLSGGCC